MQSYKPVNIEPPKSETEEPAVNGHDPEQEQKEPKKPKLNKRQVLEDALGYYYEFRRNDLTKIPEYREADKEKAKWKRMTDDDLYSIERRLQLEGYTYASDSLITKIIKSDYAPHFHPIRDYFKGLPKWDGEDHIKKLAETAKVTVKHELWRKYLKKWIVGAVANVLIEDFCANHLCLILVGEQGDSKSKWLSTLYPAPLRNYCLDGGLDPDNKDSLIRAAENFIINMDDYFADIGAKKVNSLKGFITLDKIKIRRPYGRFDEIMPKICSFVGSTNEAQFLYDDTGDRRFLCFEVQHLNLEEARKIDIDQVYAQAMDLFKKKEFTYWVTKEEQHTEQQELNSQFRVQSYEFEMIYRYLAHPEFEHTGEFMTTTQISNWLGNYTKAHLSLKRIGQALKLQGFVRKSGRDEETNISVYGYLVEKTVAIEEHKNAVERRKQKLKDETTPDDPEQW